MPRPSAKLLGRIAAHGAGGALLGYAALHPVSMLLVAIAATAHPPWPVLVKAAFSGHHLLMALYFALLAGVAGGLQGAYVHRLRELYGRVRELSRTDALTSLDNRRRLFETLDRELERAKRAHTDLAVLMMDVDHFKRVNDENGHRAGDYVLRALAVLVRAHTRPVDVVARYGGEEFVVLAPGIGAAGGAALAERLREAVASHAFGGPENDAPLRVTVSVGVATYPEAGPDAEALISAADAQLYAAKSAGRNSVRPAGISTRTT